MALALGAAIFLTEFAPRWLRTPVGTLIELLAGVPSVIYGLWGLFVLVPLLRDVIWPVIKSFPVSVLYIGPIPNQRIVCIWPPKTMKPTHRMTTKIVEIP